MIRANLSFSLIKGGILLFTLFTLSYSQDEIKEKPVAPIKFDEIGEVSNCEIGKRTSQYFVSLSSKPDHQGYIINYGTDEDIASRERLITNKIAFRHFDRSRITFVRGGYLQVPTTEFWILPPNSEYPELSKGSIDPPPTSPGTSLFKTRSIESLEPFILDSVRKEESQRDDIDPDVNSDDPRKDMDEEDRHAWADVYIPLDLRGQKGSKIVIIFYADERRYDLRGVTTFVEEGRDFLAKHAKLPKDRMIVEFGGYRESPQAELWFVPQTGRYPKARPDELCKEDESQTNNSANTP